MALEAFIMSLYGHLITWTYVLIVLLILYKIFQIVMSFANGESATGGDGDDGDDYDYRGRRRNARRRGNRDRGGDDDPEGDGRGNNDRGYVPGRVYPFRGRHNGDYITLWWAPNHEDDQVNHYEIERRSFKPRRLRAGWDRWMGSILPSERWRRLAYISRACTVDEPFIDDRNRNRNTYVQWFGNFPINPTKHYEYRIRAVNSYGRGKWSYLRLSPDGAMIWMPVIDGEGVRDDQGQLEGHVEMRRG